MRDRGLAMLVIASGLVLASPALAEAPPEDIDLRLFQSSEIASKIGCSVLLWQSDRDPAKDKFAYLFDEKLLGQNHVRQSTRIKIGGDVKSLKRVATAAVQQASVFSSTSFTNYPNQMNLSSSSSNSPKRS